MTTRRPETIKHNPEQYGVYTLHETNHSITFYSDTSFKQSEDTYEYDAHTGYYHRWHPKKR